MSPDFHIPPAILSGVSETLCKIGNLTVLTPEQDFYDAGITSLMALPILLDLEDRFQVTIPDDVFIAARSMRALAEMIVKLK